MMSAGLVLPLLRDSNGKHADSFSSSHTYIGLKQLWILALTVCPCARAPLSSPRARASFGEFVLEQFDLLMALLECVSGHSPAHSMVCSNQSALSQASLALEVMLGKTTAFAEKFQEVKEAAKLAREKSQEKMETSSDQSQESGRETPSGNQASSLNGTDDEKISHVPDDTALKSENDRLKSVVEQSKKLETELQALKDSNARLTDTLQEANSNAEGWKSKVMQSQGENNQLRNKAAETANRDLSEKMTLLQSDIDDSQQKQKNMKSELKKFMDVLDGKIDELHEVRQGISKLGVDN
ncbi:hypothetical protein cypCar_00039954 [Cyprinus carpio]|nr:hypothetical protein cypCar_00039954 [Cyprinus carpio]